MRAAPCSLMLQCLASTRTCTSGSPCNLTSLLDPIAYCPAAKPQEAMKRSWQVQPALQRITELTDVYGCICSCMCVACRQEGPGVHGVQPASPARTSDI